MSAFRKSSATAQSEKSGGDRGDAQRALHVMGSVIPAENRKIFEAGTVGSRCVGIDDSCTIAEGRVFRSRRCPDRGGSPSNPQRHQLYPRNVPSGRSTDSRTAKQEP